MTDVLAALYAKRPQVIKPGLDRMKRALPYLEPAALAAPTVLIGGTNGKGTTTAYLAQMLVASGRAVGVFTSPHLVSFAERIQVYPARRLTEADLALALKRLEARIPSAVYEPLSFFEVTTLLALLVFHENATAINLLEVGMGGRFDATNAVDPVLSIIASIGLDHQEYLGDTTAKIAFEKAGIIRAGRPVVLGGLASFDAAAEGVLLTAARAGASPVFRTGDAARVVGDKLELRVGGSLASKGRCRRIALPDRWRGLPTFLEDNLLKAAIAFDLLAGPSGASDALLARAFDATRLSAGPQPPALRARCERLIVGGVSLLLDVGHNPAGAAALVASLPGVRRPGEPPPGEWPALVSMFGDKDCDSVLDTLRPGLGPLHLWQQSTERTWIRERLAGRHQNLAWYLELPTAYEAAAAAARQRGAPLVVCGSVQGVGAILKHLRVDP